VPAYWLSRCKVIDPVEYKKYTDLVPSIIAKYGGKFQIMEGTDRFHRFIVIEFPTLEQAVKSNQSPEYQKAAAYRRAPGVGEVEQVMVDGGDATI
jgi:uncharacterized protein (DUF1330 family)